jgi:hypothetical protein
MLTVALTDTALLLRSLQLSVKTVCAVIGDPPFVSEPTPELELAVSEKPFVPVRVQLCTFDALQSRVALDPLRTRNGLA